MAHSTMCPVCNGLEQLTCSCFKCGNPMNDYGKLSDYYAPYSPYRPIDDLKETNGYLDLQLQQCMHTVICSVCETEAVQAVDEKMM